MRVIEIFLPLSDNQGKRFDRRVYDCVREELLIHFDGVTTFLRAPAEGLGDEEGITRHDDIIIFEVMAETVDEPWWADFRKNQELVFKQNKILIRACEITLL